MSKIRPLPRTTSNAVRVGTGAVALAVLMTILAARCPAAADDREGDDNEAPATVEIVDGRTRLHIDPDEYARLGIAVAAPVAHQLAGETPVFGEVIKTGELLSLHYRILTDRQETQSAGRAVATQAAIVERLERTRKQGISVDLAQLDREHRRLEDLRAAARAANLRLRADTDTAVNAWGGSLAKIIGSDDAPLIAELTTQREFIVLVALPENVASTHIEQRSVVVASDFNRTRASTATWLGPAVESFGAIGPSYFVRAAAADLREGMRVSIWIGESDKAVAGYLIPKQALVWYAGAEWAYVQVSPGVLERRRLKVRRTELNDVFIENGLQPGETVVSTGAPSLLGEEFRWSIPDEDDD